MKQDGNQGYGYTQREKKHTLLECPYFHYFQLLRSEILHDVFFLKVHQCVVVKLQINTLQFTDLHASLAIVHVYVDFACFPRAVSWVIQFCCLSVF